MPCKSVQGRYRVRYEAATREALDCYLNEHTPRLRADFAAHFLTGVQLTREVWETVQPIESASSSLFLRSEASDTIKNGCHEESEN